MGQKTAGDCYVKVDGDQIVVSGGCEAPLTDTTRETVVPGYFSEKERTPYIKCDAVDTPNFPRTKLAEGTNMTVTCEFKNGRTYVLTGAYLVGDPTTSGDDAKAGLEFHGIKGTWQ